MTVEQVARPVLATIPRVELIHAGTWNISTGEATFTSEDLHQAIASQDCPAVRRPVLKLGHTDPRFDGQPAVGFVSNLSTDGSTLWGDFAGMPRWLADIAASAYPDRSIEGYYDYQCQLGHTHPFVLTGVALLGETPPGIGTLESLQDIGNLYGVAATATAPDAGRKIIITVHASGGSVAQQIAASTTVEDVRRAFYTDAPWSMWIEEIQLDPLQIITNDDETGARARIPFTIDASKDGEQAITFGVATPVVVRYEDVPVQTSDPGVAASAPHDPNKVVFASREKSRMAAPVPPATEPVESNKQEDKMSGLTMDAIKTRLGLEPDTELTDEVFDAAIKSLTPAPVADPEPAMASGPKLPAGSIIIDKMAYEELKIAASAGQEARKRQLREDRDNTISAAVAAGKIAPSRRAAWAKSWDADPEGTAASIAELEQIFPVQASGYSGAQEGNSDDIIYSSLFGDTKEV